MSDITEAERGAQDAIMCLDLGHESLDQPAAFPSDDWDEYTKGFVAKIVELQAEAGIVFTDEERRANTA